MRRTLLFLVMLARCSRFDPRAVVKLDGIRLDIGKRVEATAVVVDAAGRLLTAAHCVEGVDVLRVTLADGRRVVADVVSVDAERDLAVLRINARGLHAISTARVVVGQRVRAYGRHAAGTVGRITAESEGWAFTDAAFGPGDSGGALVNGRGDVVGVLLGVATGGRLAAVEVQPTP